MKRAARTEELTPEEKAERSLATIARDGVVEEVRQDGEGVGDGESEPESTIPADQGREMPLTGHASTFGPKDDGLMITKGAMEGSIERFMEFPTLFASHRMGVRDLVGRVDKLEVDDQGLAISTSVSSAERDVQVKIREKSLKAFSIGFLIDFETLEFMPETEIFAVHDMQLIDVSLVPLPLDRDALFTEARRHQRDALQARFRPPVATPEPVRDDGPPSELALMLSLYAAQNASLVARALSVRAR